MPSNLVDKKCLWQIIDFNYKWVMSKQEQITIGTKLNLKKAI